MVKNIRIIGTISAMNIESCNVNYLNLVGKKLKERCLEKKIYIRPLGNVVYFMPPYCIQDDELEYAYDILYDELKNL